MVEAQMHEASEVVSGETNRAEAEVAQPRRMGYLSSTE